jgi:hypothetical protein
MAQDLDQFPLYDPITKRNTDELSQIWSTALASFYLNLIGYLTQYGILLPQVTNAQIKQVQAPQDGQILFNTSTGDAQYYNNGGWTPLQNQFGVLLPSFTNTQETAIANPQLGQMIYNSDMTTVRYYNGSWTSV